MTQSIYIYGAGGHGRVVLDICRASGVLVDGFLDGDPHLHGRCIEGVDVLGGVDRIDRNHPVVVAVGNNESRAGVAGLVMQYGKLVSVIHPTAIVSERSIVNPGCVVCERAIVKTGAVVGLGAVLNTAAIIEHDCCVGDFAFVGPGAVTTGRVIIEDRAFVGAGAVILPGVRIGTGAVVGAGAVVTKDVPDGATVAGNPARILARVPGA